MMSFDIHQPVFSPDGEYLEDAAIRYREVLMERFEASPEEQDLVRQGGTVGWADTLMDLGMGYLEVTPATMTAEQLKSRRQARAKTAALKYANNCRCKIAPT